MLSQLFAVGQRVHGFGRGMNGGNSDSSVRVTVSTAAGRFRRNVIRVPVGFAPGARVLQNAPVDDAAVPELRRSSRLLWGVMTVEREHPARAGSTESPRPPQPISPHGCEAPVRMVHGTYGSALTLSHSVPSLIPRDSRTATLSRFSAPAVFGVVAGQRLTPDGNRNRDSSPATAVRRRR